MECLGKYKSKGQKFMVNRCIGVHVICGPIDRHFTVNTDNIIAHGANVLIATTKVAIEQLANWLSELGLILPKKGFHQLDNSGENKVLAPVLIYSLIYTALFSNYYLLIFFLLFRTDICFAISPI